MTQKIYVANDGTEFSSKEAVLEYQTAHEKFETEFALKRQEFLKLREISSKALASTYAFQEECSHEYVTVESKSDTGNYDRSQDSYWFVIECKCCEKRWNEDQETSQYRGRRYDDPKIEVIRKY